MGSVRSISTVVVAAVVLSFLLSPTEVEGSCDAPYGSCTLWRDCKESCLKWVTRAGQTFFDGKCRPRATFSVWSACFCCYYDDITLAKHTI